MSAHAFDDLAETYDSTFTDTAVGRALRDLVWARLERTFGAGSRVLEIGCGTGEDALRLASRGLRVVATDASRGMIQIAREKALRSGHADRIEFLWRGMENLADLPDHVSGTPLFDGVLSNFGVINCARNLPAVVGDVAGLLAPGARLVWVVMGRHVPWEWAWYLSRGSWRKATRRLSAGGTPWRGLTISYPTPAEMKAHLAPWFTVDRLTALGFALPPSYAAAWLNRSPRLLSAFTRMEKMAQRSSALASYADHYIVEATRLPADVAAPSSHHPGLEAHPAPLGNRSGKFPQ